MGDMMLENKRKITISKNILISLCFVCLIVAIFAFSTDDAAAAVLNESINEIELDMDVEDKLENSQIDESVKADENLRATKTFKDIQEALR